MGFINLVFSLLGGCKTSIGSLTLDALLTETNNYDSTVTDYPVEVGSPIVDHISPSAEKLSITGVVTGAGVMMFDSGGKYKMIAAKEVIKQIYEQQVPITVVTGMDIYPNFAMETCTVTRGDSLEKLNISMTLKKVIFAIAKNTDLPPAKVSNKASKKGGKPVKGKAGETKTNAGSAKTKPVLSSEVDKIVKGIVND
ncbi:phage baseplate protein [Phocoenobacter skyensis]|uniref:Dit-like phage tail protein N-terminal domain-containing protein n=1 Tax=Phocoenobacter skyensis TaxID=97481 RepID=A0ABT9JID4_9PAST|nr:hypothetical protein [Pasteurella skyensis]MDP8078328.1 hypothetical protein [Pasteurella skyensis]MDP8084580.1 hypothetical protein [Pasteurella skyensis]